MIKFANKSLPSYVKVTDIKYTILPSIDSKTERIYGRAGSYDFGIELGERKIEVELMIIGANQNDVIKKAREFATWLFYKDLQPLVILDEPDKQYMARVVGDTDIAELYRTGTATINFLCPSAYAESIGEKKLNWVATDYTPYNVINSGSAECFPVFDLEIKQDTPSIALISNDKFVQIGADNVPDKPKFERNPRQIWDEMISTTGWTTASQVDGGVVMGTFSSNGYEFTQTGLDYGQYTTGWHGASMVKSLPKQLDNFIVEGRITFKSTSPQQLGRIEIYLLDANNVQIGKVAMADSTYDGKFPLAEARAGSLQDGKYFVRNYGDYKGVFENYEGCLWIAKVGKGWSAYFSKIEPNGFHHTELYREWTDTHNNYSGKKLAKIQIHIGAYGESEPVSIMRFTDLKVWERTVDEPAGQIPIIFKAGDLVTIDNQKAIVTLNGRPIFTELDPSSDFFPLDVGNNGLIVSPPKASVNIRYKERWL
ncbi:phage tail family protein [Bacillus cereus group sp. TH36-2LC]|uniref:distal tail protein Dit n=1 Tax=Bacillus cereus group sp. TH36-2LC TaxID=3018040 RepID=UPI0022E1B443|nr:distal tail protein Dit [Bacillus cereus group sp. TH36-2LC]MDA1509569.1 phage tail family protein [Bacillus cereus group sp. TH36-2LC]